MLSNEMIENDFYERMSLCALEILLERGYEIILGYKGDDLYLANHFKGKEVIYEFNYPSKNLTQEFTSPIDLIENAKINEELLVDLWSEISIKLM